MTGRSLPPIARRSRTNEIFVPSGDQAVPKSSPLAHGQATPDAQPVSCCGFAPLASMTQIWPPLDDWALKAILEPSGLQSGTWSLGSEPDVTACGFDPFGVHHPDLLVHRVILDLVVVVAVDEDDLRAIRRPGRRVVEAAGAEGGAGGERLEAASVVRVDNVDLGVLIGALGAAEDDLLPSGEKSGKVAKPPRWVSWRWSEPSWCIVQISKEPLTSEQ